MNAWTRMSGRSKAVVAGVAAVALVGGGVALAAGASGDSGDITCHVDGSTLSCPIPQQTVTATTTATATATATVTVSPSRTTSTSSASASRSSSSVASSPSQSQTVAAGDYPDASNTGVPAGTKLTTVTNSYTVAAGKTASGLDIQGAVTLGKGAQLLNSKVRCIGVTDWCMQLTGQNIVSGVEIGGGADGRSWSKADAFWSGGSNAGNQLIRMNIHHTSDGGRVDGGTTIRDSWIHDMPAGDRGVEGAHGDGLQMTNGGNLVVDHCSIEGGNNDAVFVQWTDGEAVGDITITNSLITGVSRNGQQTSYGVAIVPSKVAAGATFTVTGNQFAGSFQVGPLIVPKGATVSNNTYQSTGRPVPVATA